MCSCVVIRPPCPHIASVLLKTSMRKQQISHSIQLSGNKKTSMLTKLILLPTLFRFFSQI